MKKIRYADDNDCRKINWQGIIQSIQPRTRVWRYLVDSRTHYYIGYNIFLLGKSDVDLTEFSVAISEKQQQKYNFQIGDSIKVQHGQRCIQKENLQIFIAQVLLEFWSEIIG